MCDRAYARHMADYLNELDETKRQLEERHPGWHVWYVPHLDRTVTWCAQPWPLLNEDSSEHLSEAIAQAEAARAHLAGPA
jgi:hypothetical protein